jgi:hypothetical protein
MASGAGASNNTLNDLISKQSLQSLFKAPNAAASKNAIETSSIANKGPAKKDSSNRPNAPPSEE